MRLERRRWNGAHPRSLAAELRSADELDFTVATAVGETIETVRVGGDAALIELGERFDGNRARSLRVESGEIAAATAAIPDELRSAIERGAANIRAVAEAQISPSRDAVLAEGQRIEVAEVPVGSAGIYAPGGRAPYPSSVLMGVIPAIASGVGRVVVASPPGPDGLPHQGVLAAAGIAGAHEVYAMGGAQAIAALAYGTESLEPVDVIAGPGSPWVQEAKLQVSRVVGIDGYAGPSELMAICDADARVDWLALDLCAQAEHGADGVLVVASTDPGVLERIAAEVDRIAAESPSVHEARIDLVEVPDLDAAVALAEAFAPEHLELDCVDSPDRALTITTSGCVFIGSQGGAAFGDYAAGSNHVLPTGGAGRFTGPLGPGTFRRRISRVTLDPSSAAALAPVVDAFARAEGFPVHGRSATARGEASPNPGEPSS